MSDGAIVDSGNRSGTIMKRILSFGLLVLLSACGRNQPAPVAANAAPLADPADPAFVGKIWISTTPGHALGTMLIFLPDRTLVMDSCHETYRLVKWGVAGEHIRWLEDTIPIEAAVEMPRPNQLILRIAGIDQEQSYMTASVPYVCPDMPK
jgi:hypothetical protein